MTTAPLREAHQPDAGPARRHLTPLSDAATGTLSAGGVDAVVDRLVVLDETLTDADRTALLASLQRLERAAQAAQLRVMLALDEDRHDQREQASGRASDRGSSAPGVAAQVGAALGCSASAAGFRLGLARVADRELPRLAGLHRRGLVSVDHVRAVAAATIGVGRDDRLTVDEEVAPHAAGWTVRELEARARAIAYELDPGAATAAHDRVVADRHVSGRPVPGGMMRLSALLPLVEGVACLASLGRGAQAAKAAGDARSVSQLRADLLVQRSGPGTPRRGCLATARSRPPSPAGCCADRTNATTAATPRTAVVMGMGTSSGTVTLRRGTCRVRGSTGTTRPCWRGRRTCSCAACTPTPTPGSWSPWMREVAPSTARCAG